MLRLTSGDVRRFREAAHVVASPEAHPTVDAWRAAGAAATRALFVADRLLWLLPPCRAAGADGAPGAAPCFYGEGELGDAVAAHERFRTRAPGRPTDPDEAMLARILAARHALGLTVWTGPQLAARPPSAPGGACDVRRSAFLNDVTMPAGLWDCVQLGAGAPGHDALLLVGGRGGAGARFAADDAVAVAGLLWPAFAAGVRAALARWGAPGRPGPPESRGIGFTPREREVAVLLAARRTNAEIADALGVTGHTARHHVERVMRKLGARSRRDVGAAPD